jgi:sugar phosphate isomerase/epimerase
MKLSIVLSTQPASFSAVAYKGNLAANLHKIKQLRFDGVELAIRNPNELNFSEIELSLKENKLEVPAIGTGQAYGEDELSFTHHNPGVRKAAIERIISHMEFAEKLGAVVIIGLIRGQNCSEVGKQQAEDWLLEALKICASQNKTVKLAIEPINRYETDLLNTVAESLHFLDQLNSDNVGLLLDTFHMNIEEPSITESLLVAGKQLFHVHVADSNRWFPGAGHIDFSAIVRTLEHMDYQSFLSGEILPLPDPDSSAKNLVDFLRKIIKQHLYDT